MHDDRDPIVTARRWPRSGAPIVSIATRALASASVAAEDALPRETGGILLGWREPDAVVVSEMIEVVDPEASPMSYVRRHAHAEAALQRALEDAAPGDPVGYVGEWHAHPAPQGPSRQDRRELRALARRTAHPVALVVLAHNPELAEWTRVALVACSCRVRRGVISEEEAA